MGEGCVQPRTVAARTPPPHPLPQGEGEYYPAPAATSPELWLSRPGHPPVRFAFDEVVRADAAATVARLRGLGLDVHLLSGDRAASVRQVAAALGIA